MFLMSFIKVKSNLKKQIYKNTFRFNKKMYLYSKLKCSLLKIYNDENIYHYSIHLIA